jgi:hypothetical protein
MTEIQSALNLTDQQTLERCVGTQTYVDDRLRDGWQFVTPGPNVEQCHSQVNSLYRREVIDMAATVWDPSDVDVARETSRRITAILVLGTITASIDASYLIVWLSDAGEFAERADVALRIGSPLVTIIGTVLGLYFGRESTT